MLPQKRLFPNCTYSTASTSWIICNNNWGKSVGRTRDIEAMNHHINDLKEGAKRLKPSSVLRMHHHTIRSLEDAQIKVRAPPRRAVLNRGPHPTSQSLTFALIMAWSCTA